MNTPKIILLEHRADYKAIYGLNLNVYLGAEVLIASTVKQVITFLEHSDCACIFVDTRGYTVDIGEEVHRYLSKKNDKIPFYIVGKTTAPSDEVTIFDAKIELKEILKTVAKTLKITSQLMADQNVPKMYPLPLEFILPGWECSHNIFHHANGNYETLFQTGDILTCDELDTLIARGVESLYIDADDRLKFVNAATFQISAKLNDPNLSASDRMKTTAQAYQMVMEQARRIGIVESTLKLANSCISSMNLIIKESSNLDSLLQNLLNQPGTYLYRHSLLISYIGSHIIKKMPWGSKEQQDKFAFVSFFHDIVLGRDELAKFRSDMEIQNSALSNKDKELVLQHALLSAKLLSNVKTIPFGTETIIKQHHGSKSGKSLSKLSMGISPLAIVFIFAEEWAHLSLETEDAKTRPKKKQIISKLHSKYNIPAFNKILPILHTLEF